MLILLLAGRPLLLHESTRDSGRTGMPRNHCSAASSRYNISERYETCGSPKPSQSTNMVPADPGRSASRCQARWSSIKL
jgi:hypothetical protein